MVLSPEHEMNVVAECGLQIALYTQYWCSAYVQMDWFTAGFHTCASNHRETVSHGNGESSRSAVATQALTTAAAAIAIAAAATTTTTAAAAAARSP